jgi:hypothetical protein
MFSTGDGYLQFYVSSGKVHEFTSGYYRGTGSIITSAGLSMSCTQTSPDGAELGVYCGDGVSTPRNQGYYFDNYYDHLRVIRNGAGEYAWTRDSAGWFGSCSKTIKHDIRPLTKTDYTLLTGLINETTVYSYKRNDVPDKTEVGLISEETPEVMGSVSQAGISPIKALGFLYSVFKEQQTQITELKSDIEEYKKSIQPK